MWTFVVCPQFIALFTVIKLDSCHLVEYTLFGSNKLYYSILSVWFHSVVHVKSFVSWWDLLSFFFFFWMGGGLRNCSKLTFWTFQVVSYSWEERTKFTIKLFVQLSTLGFSFRATQISWLWVLRWERVPVGKNSILCCVGTRRAGIGLHAMNSPSLTTP